MYEEEIHTDWQHDNDEEIAGTLPEVQLDSAKEKLHGSTHVHRDTNVTFSGGRDGTSNEKDDPKIVSDLKGYYPDRRLNNMTFERGLHLSYPCQASRVDQAANKSDSESNITSAQQKCYLSFPNKISEPSREDQAANKSDSESNITSAQQKCYLSFPNKISEPSREDHAANKSDSQRNITTAEQEFQLSYPNQTSELSREDQAANKGDLQASMISAGTSESGDSGLIADKALDMDSAVKKDLVSKGKMAHINCEEALVSADKKHNFHTHTVNGKLSDDNKKQNDEDDDDDNKDVPIDRGWAWMIVLGCFTIMLIYYVPVLVHSVLLLDFIEQFDCSVSVITAVLSLGSITYCIATQVTANILLPHFSTRTVTTFAAIMNVIASLVFVASVNIPTFFIINTVKYLATGCSLVSALTLIGFYFRRRRALASALGLLGVSVASVVMPPLIRYLKAEYGFRGCFLVLAGVEMHAIPATLLLRPLSSYMSKRSDVARETSTKTEQVPLLTVPPTDTANAQENVDTVELVDPPQNWMGISKDRIMDNEKDQNVFLAADQNQKLGNLSTKEQIQIPDDDSSIVSISRSESGLHYLRPENKHHLGASVSHAVCGPHDWPVLTSSLMGSAVSITAGVVSEAGTLQENVESTDRCHYISWIKKIVDISLLKNFLCLMILVNYILGNAGVLSEMYLPSYAIEIGVSPPRAAALLTIFGATDMVGRIALGFFADFKFLRPTKIIALASLALGTVNHFVSLYQSFGLLVFFAVMHGLLSSATMNLNISVIVDVLGIDYLARMLAMCSIFINLSLVLQFPLQGLLIEATGSFVTTFHYIGTLFLLSAAILFCEPCIRKQQTARETNDIRKVADQTEL